MYSVILQRVQTWEFGNCRGRLSSSIWDYADRDLGSPGFVYVHEFITMVLRFVTLDGFIAVAFDG